MGAPSVVGMTTNTTTATANAIGLIVSDLSAAMSFYAVLGVRFGPVAGDGHVDADLGAGFRLMLDTEDSIRSFHPEWVAPTGSSRAAIAFMADAPATVDTLAAALVEAGGTEVLAAWDAPWGQRYATVADPDGNNVDLYAALA